MEEKRMSRCIFCGTMVESDESLPYFKFRPLKIYDTFICGCKSSGAFIDTMDILDIE